MRIPNFVWSVYSPIINQRTSGFEHFSPATHLRSSGILRGVFIKNPQPVDHGPRNLARVTHPDYPLQLLTIGGPVDEEGLWILRPGQVHKSMDDPSLNGETLNLNIWNSQTV